MSLDFTSGVQRGAFDEEPPLQQIDRSNPVQEQLSRLGGAAQVLKLLGSEKEHLKETAALVLSNITFTNTAVCITIVKGGKKTLSPLVENISSENENIAVNVVRTLANCAANLRGDICHLFFKSILDMGGLKPIVGALSVKNKTILDPTLLLVGNMFYEDYNLASQVRFLGGLESLMGLLYTDEVEIHDSALAVLVNCCYGNNENCRELVDLGAIKILLQIVGISQLKSGVFHDATQFSESARFNSIRILGFLVQHVPFATFELYDHAGFDCFSGRLFDANDQVKEISIRTLCKCAKKSFCCNAQSVCQDGESLSSGTIYQHRLEQLEAIRIWFLSDPTLKNIVLMTDHEVKRIRRNAQKCLDIMFQSSYAGETLLPSVEQGIVPALQKIKLSTCKKTKIFVRGIFACLKLQIKGATLQLLLRTLCVQGNETLRGNVAVILAHLSLETVEVRHLFISSHGIKASVSLLRTIEGRSFGIEFLKALLKFTSIFPKNNLGFRQFNAHVPSYTSLIFNAPRGSDVTLTLKLAVDENRIFSRNANTQRQTIATCHVHKTVLAQNSQKFELIFSNSNGGGTEYSVTVSDVEGMIALLKYIYTVKTDVLWEYTATGSKEKPFGACNYIGIPSSAARLRKLLSVAHEFGIFRAEEAIVEKALTLINCHTITELFDAGICCKNNKLSKACYIYTVENFSKISQYLNTVSFEKLLSLIEAYVKIILCQSNELSAQKI
jgi:hypothetical protein